MAKGKKRKSGGKVAAQRAEEALRKSETHRRTLSAASTPGRSMTSGRSLRTIGDLAPGDHLCCLYETEEEHRAVLTPFLRQGLERGEKVLYIVDARTAEVVMGYLRDEGLDAESYLARGQLTILTADDAYLKQGVFDPDGMIALLRTETERALAEGYAALRITGEMSWALRGLPGSERLIEYEAKLNEFLPGSKSLAICQYDRRAFDPPLLLHVLCTHPAAVIGTEIYDNFYYMPPAEFLADEPAAAELRHWVENLAERKRVVEELTKHREHLAELVEERTAELQLKVTERKRAEEDLRASKVLLENTFASLNEAVFIVESNTRTIIACNSAAEHIFGYNEKEMVGRNTEFLHLDRTGYEEFGRKLFLALDANEAFHTEHRVRRKDGSTILTDHTVTEIVDDSGQRTGLVSVVRDVTERKRAEEELTKHREHLAELVEERTADLQLEVTERKRVVEAIRERTHHLGERVKELNCLYSISRLVEQPGISLEELLQGAVELIPPAWQYPEVTCARIMLEDQEFRTENFRESTWRQTSDIIVLGRRIGTVEVCYLDERPESDEGPFLKEERSLIDAVAHTLGRATENKRVQERIQEQAAFLQAVLDALNHPFYVVDSGDYTIKMANAAARLGRLPKATTCYALTHGLSEPCGGDEHVCPLEVVKETKAPVTVEHTHYDADGNASAVEVHCHPVLDDEGNVKQVIEYALDITERRRAEEQLEKLRSEFLGMVTHELKTPLTAIKGSAATALGSQRAFDAQENRELFQIVDEQADRLRDLMDNLLDMTRIEAGSLSVSPEPTDLRAVLEEARATFVHSGGSHEVQLQLSDDLPPVNADRHRTVQVLTNLLNNAARFSPATAPITIAAEHDPLHVTIHVRDRGRGIPREKLPLMFKKFSQIHDDAGQKLSGTGLGLAICKGIVEAQGGRIWADSAGEGQGSTFSFTLPVATEVSVKSLSDETRRAVHLGRVRRAGERTRVLAVDDEPQVLRYVQRSLDEAGYQAIVTSDPSQVAKLVELEEPDLVLLDLRLPGTSGFDLLRRIREFSGVPVIFLTASDRDEDTVRALRMGADDYITKPFSPSELLARIGAALRRRLLPDLMEAQPPFVLGDLTINFAERRVTVEGQDVSLSATEYKILYELATHAGRALTYDHILQRVWGEEYSGETELVRSFIRNLRRKLGDDVQHPRFIFTERQVGYRMPKP